MNLELGDTIHPIAEPNIPKLDSFILVYRNTYNNSWHKVVVIYIWVMVVVVHIIIIFWVNSTAIHILLLFWVRESITVTIEMEFYINPETCGLNISIKLI